MFSLENNLDSRVGKIEIALGKLEVVTQDHKEEIKSLKDDNVLLHRLTINQETLTQLVKDNQENMKEFSSTINNVNLNLTRLNASSDELRSDVNNLESELKDVKEKSEVADDVGKFNVVEFLSKDIPKYIGLALIGAILYYIGWVTQ